MTLRNLYYNYISHPNYFDDGGIVYIQDSNGFVRPDSVQTINGNYTSGINPQNAVLNDYQLNQVNKAERKQTASEKAQNFIDNMNGGGASGWNAIGPAASNIASALLDTESDLADRTAAAMGMPALANIWKADWGKGNEALTDYRNKLNNIKKNSFIQDASSSWGAANAVKLNSKPIAPITPQSQLLTWKDFRGNMFMKGAGAVAQGAASGSVGGPWGAAGGAITGLFSSLFGGIGARKRAKSAYNSYLNKWQTLNSANQAAFNKANIDQTLSNMQALANGNLQQRINDMSNIRAFGGGLDLSPNMMSLWNNKQQIDQQKVNMQQMNFGLGNSFNYKNMFPDGGIIPPNRPLTKEEIDRLTPAEREEYVEKQAIRLYKELAAPSPALYDSREEDAEHTYNVLNRPDQNPFSSLNVFANLFKPSNSGYIFSEENKRKEAAEKAQQHSGGSISWGSKLTDDDIDRMINTAGYDWDDRMQRLRRYEEEKKYGKKYESPRNPMPSASLFDKAVDTVLGWLGYGKINEDKIYDDNSKFYANGGQMNSSDLPDNMQYYANGGTHEENPYGGIQVGVDQQGNPNLVEEGEFRWGDYVFSDRINVDPTLLSRYNLAPATKHQGKKANKGKLSYADMAKKYAKKNNELANDPIGKNTLEAYMKRLQDAQEDQKFQDSMEQQKQDAINQYRKTLSTPQQGNPMYGAMKYNGMGNAATQQGVNAGMSDLGQQGDGNEVLSNTNRSGNNMLHAFGGNLYPIGGLLRRLFGRTQSNQQPSKNEWGINKSLDNVWGHEPTFEQRWEHPAIYMPNMPEYLNESLQNIGLGTYNGHAPMYDYIYTPAYGKGSNDLYGNYVKNQYLRNKYLSDMSFGSTMQPAQVQQNLDNQTNGNNLTFEQWRDMQYGNNNSPYMMSSQEDTPNVSVLQAQSKPVDGSTSNTDYTTGYNGAANINTGMLNLTDGIKRDTTTTFGTAAINEDPKQVPHYNTAGEYAMFGKGFTPMLYDWMNKTNFKYDPNQRPAYELADMGNNSTFLRTADTVGGYRAPNLMDAERMNNAAQAQGLAALQSALSTANGNRGFAAAQAAQNAYNTQMGIGNNYATTQQINNEERFKNDSFNTALDQANANIRNSMYQDNQKGQQVGQQMAIDTKKAANDYILRNELYADATNREAMANRAANQATWTDNALNYFIAQAQKNDILNAKNNDITNPYWTDKNGVMHYIGDSGLNSAIYNAFTDGSKEWGNYAVNNGTFSGDRLKAWNALQEKYSAADLKAHPELWKSLVLQEKQARKEEAEKAELAKTDRLNNQRYAFDNNMAQLNNYRTLYGDKFTDSQWYDDLMRRYNDVANANEFNDVNNLEYWNRVIGDKLNYWQRYNTPVTANQSAYGGYINNNNKSNKREYYNYMRR